MAHLAQWIDLSVFAYKVILLVLLAVIVVLSTGTGFKSLLSILNELIQAWSVKTCHIHSLWYFIPLKAPSSSWPSNHTRRSNPWSKLIPTTHMVQVHLYQATKIKNFLKTGIRTLYFLVMNINALSLQESKINSFSRNICTCRLCSLGIVLTILCIYRPFVPVYLQVHIFSHPWISTWPLPSGWARSY